MIKFIDFFWDRLYNENRHGRLWFAFQNRNLSEVFGIKTTISDLNYQAQKVSSPVFGVDFSKLSKKKLFNSEENDIHKLSRYVKEIQPDERLPLDSIPNDRNDV